jgi:hypothetical protein
MLQGMEPPSYQVIVVRAWREKGGLRIRLLANGVSSRQWVVGSIAEAIELLSSILAELLVTPTRPNHSDRPASPHPQV